MATYYWVGGSGTWDQVTTRNWAATSGGTGNAGVPTSVDDVIFDANSDTGGPFTVTVGGTTSFNTPFCKTFTTGGAGGALDQVMTLAGTGRIYLYGSMTLPASNFVYSGSPFFTFQDSATLTTNGITVGQITLVNPVTPFNPNLVFNLGSALTCNSMSPNYGTLNTNNFNITTSNITVGPVGANSVAKIWNLGSSTITLSGGGIVFGVSVATNIPLTNLTVNPGTSTVICTNPNPAWSLTGTANNVSFTNSSTSGTIAFSGSTTFNNLTFTSKTVTSNTSVAFQENTTNTVTGTLTLGTANTGVIRMAVRCATFRLRATLNVATMAAMSDIDFRDIDITGAAAPVSGTRISNQQNTSGITFTAGANKYWNLPAGGDWTATAWALTSGGAVSINNYPLAQDSVIIEDTGLNSGATITFTSSPAIGNFTTATRTLPATIAFLTNAPGFYGNVTLSSAITMTASGTALIGLGAGYNITQTITSAGRTWPRGLSFVPVNGTVSFADALTVTGTASFSTGQLPNITAAAVFKSGVTHSATAFVFSTRNNSRWTISSSVPGTKYTLSQTSGYVNAYFMTITDSTVTGGAIWTAAKYYGNIDGGNNTGWNFPALSAINRGTPTSLSFGFRI